MVVIEDAADAVPMARALLAGGVEVVEVTLRSKAALNAIRAIAHALPDVIVGAGTLTRAEDFERAAAAGARFAVSPGLTPALTEAARASALPFMPGALTPSEMLAARASGFTALKLFPAEVAGGVALLKALRSILPDLIFCPTGGIDARSAASYLALDNVACVGGSWLTPVELLREKNWQAIEALARAACDLRRERGARPEAGKD